MAKEQLPNSAPYPVGEKYLNNDAYSNSITIKLQDGGTLKVNAIILSLNSPVFDRMISELYQTEINMDDFGSAAVGVFIRSLYTGKLEIPDRPSFRDVNKMAVIFKVSWLRESCNGYFANSVSADSLEWAFHEGVFSLTTLNEDLCLGVLRKHLEKAACKEAFVSERLESSELGENDLIALVNICHSDVTFLMKHLIDTLNSSTGNVERKIKVLENMNLSWCYATNKHMFLDLYDCVRENLIDVDFGVLKPIFNRFKQVIVEKPSADILPHLNTEKKLEKKQNDIFEHKLLVNVQSQFLKDMLNLDAHPFKVLLQQNNEIKNLYMYFDCIFTWFYRKQCFPAHLDILFDTKEISNLRLKRGWDKVAIQYLQDMKHNLVQNLKDKNIKTWEERVFKDISDENITVNLSSNYTVSAKGILHDRGSNLHPNWIANSAGFCSEGALSVQEEECSDKITPCGIAITGIEKDNKFQVFLTSNGRNVHCHNIPVEDVHLCIHYHKEPNKCCSMIHFLIGGNITDFATKVQAYYANTNGIFRFKMYIRKRALTSS